MYYVREDIMKRAISVRAARMQPVVNAQPCSRALQVARENLIALGVCIGKFTHTNKFILTIGALDVLAQHAKFKVCAQCSWLACAWPPQGCNTLGSVFKPTRLARCGT